LLIQKRAEAVDGGKKIVGYWEMVQLQDEPRPTLRIDMEILAFSIGQLPPEYCRILVAEFASPKHFPHL
jgi:hypothetical protein